MKFFSNICYWVLLVSPIMYACENSAENQGLESDKILPGITILSPEDLRPVLPQQGDEIRVLFAASSDWSVSPANDRANSWITVNPDSGYAGENEIVITVAANQSYEERNATIVLKCGTASENIVVTQKQKDALTVTTSKFDVGGKGGEINVEVNANISFDISINSGWIRRKSSNSSRALTTSNLCFTIDPNKMGETREGKIIINSGELSETIRVYQTYEDFITLTKRMFTVPEEGGGIDIEVKSTLSHESRIISGEDWISENQTRAVSTHTYHYTVLSNESYDAREAKIAFYNPDDPKIADTISIFQMFKGAILVARNEYQFDTNGGTIDLSFQTNLETEIRTSASWIRQEPLTRALAEQKLRFSIAENTDRKEREGTITIKEKNGDRQQLIVIRQCYVDREREALIALYEATNGNSWTDNTNWCSDRPIGEWYGVQVDSNGSVIDIKLYNNNLSGYIPDIFDNLPNLKMLHLSKNELTGELPQSLYSVNLSSLYLADNRLQGEVSELVGNWQNLSVIEISKNNFSGVIPKAFGTLPRLTYCGLMMNRFSGELSSEILKLEIKAENDENFKFWLEPQQSGCYFTVPATREMIELGDNLYLHPDGLALEYRQGTNQAIVYEKTKSIMQSVYKKFEDVFDFVVFMYNVGNMEEIAGEIAGQAFTITNNVQGIGRELFDNSADFGSHGRMKCLIQLSSRRQIKGAFLHEVMHNWGAFDFGQQYINLNGSAAKGAPHWGISSVNGLLGGFDINTLERNVDGDSHKYRAYCSLTDWCFGTVNSSSYAYAPLELYLMGFLPPEEVPDIHYFTDLGGSSSENPSKNGIFYAGEEYILRIEDIINKLGPRIPDHNNSQKNFRALIIVVTKDIVNNREWGLMESDMIKMQKQGSSGYQYGNMNFYEATGGRGTLTLGNLDMYRK